MNSSSLRHILGLILHLGNAINTTGTKAKDHASAIQLSSLMKLNHAKAFDKKTTFLEYVARILRRNCPSLLLQYRQDLASLSRAEKIQWKDSIAELESLDDNLTEIRKMALRMALSSSSSTPLCANSSEVDELLAELSSEEEVSLLQSTSLGRFTFEACLRMASVYAEIEAAKTVFGQMVHYFGEVNEDDEHPNPQEILCNLAKFCNDLDVAVERAIASEKAKARELRRAPQSSSQSATKNVLSPSGPSGNKHRRLMVPVKSRAKARLDPRTAVAGTTGMKGLLADLKSRRLGSNRK